jgi:hypothetical protein
LFSSAILKSTYLCLINFVSKVSFPYVNFIFELCVVPFGRSAIINLMNDLSIFTDEEIQTLTRLPVQIGYYMSYADDEDGEDDDEREYRAMTACIRAVAKVYDGPGVVDDVARAALQSQDQWPAWEDGVFQTPKFAAHAIQIVQSKAGIQEAKNYRKAMMKIGSSVAMAYGEFSSFDEDEEPETGFFSNLAAKIVESLKEASDEKVNSVANISAAERAALARLSDALTVSE